MKKLLVLALSLISGGAFAQSGFTSQSNADFAKTIADKNVQLVDVRTPSEFKQGYIPTAVNIDVNGSDFKDKIEKLDKSKPVAVYCRSGARSKTAARILAAKGFTVYELDRGISNWNGKTEK